MVAIKILINIFNTILFILSDFKQITLKRVILKKLKIRIIVKNIILDKLNIIYSMLINYQPFLKT